MKKEQEKKSVFVERPKGSNVVKGSKEKEPEKKEKIYVERPTRSIHRDNNDKRESNEILDSRKEKLFELIGCAFAVVFVFWALMLLVGENPVSAVLSLLFAFFISPLRKRVFDKYNIKLKSKAVGLISGLLFLSSCGTFVSQLGVSDTTPTEVAVVETVESESEEVESVIETIEDITEEETTIEAVIESTVEEESTEPVVEEKSADMEVHFIDVGQGDATLVKADGKYMLIDAGDNTKGSAVWSYLKKQGVEKLDYLVLTHTDADHIGGADVIVNKFDIDTVFMGDFKKDNKTYEELISAFDYKGLKYSVPTVGNEYKLGNAVFTIVAPNTTYSDPNNCSIALILRNREDSFLFTGDCEEEAENDILANGIDIDCDVYKVGHHGSKTASSKNFLKVITPVYGVISCAEGNSYGHPHAESLNNLRSMSVKLFRTDEQGSIVAYSNGTEITWNCSPTDSWKAGESTESATKANTSTTSKQSTQTTTEATKVPASVPEPTPTPEPAPTPEPTPEPEPAPEPTPQVSGGYAVNAKNGKIHIVGACPATGTGDNAMTEPVYFGTYEEAEAYSIQAKPSQKKRNCGNCWK